MDVVYKDSKQPLEKRVEDLLGRMTLQEKLGQINQQVVNYSGSAKIYKSVDPRFEETLERTRKGEIGSLIWSWCQPDARNLVQKAAVEGSRLGVPVLFGMDIIHGHRTVFPIAPALACSFEPEILEKGQAVAARESRAEGVDWVFAPMCDLARDVRWGRVAETCGEDPYLSALCNKAQVKGFQGDDPSSPDHLAACLKHFIGYSCPRGGRDYSDTEITDWTLRNAHLPAYKDCVEAGALTIMSSFNATGGIPSVANHRTLTEILRDEWGFKGLVVSDWQAVQEMISWGYAKDRADAARLAICAGNDMDMLSEAYFGTLAKQVESGKVPLSVVDEAVRRVLRVKFQLGLFERPYVDAGKFEASVRRPADVKLARECVAKSTVLMKNENDALPLAKDALEIALIGPFGDDRAEMLGCWSARGEKSEVVTLAAGLAAKLPEKAKLTVVKGCSVSLAHRTKTLQDGSTVRDESAQDDVDFDVKGAVSAAKKADVVVMAVGEPRGWTGEGGSRGYLGLTGKQQELFDAVAATSKKIVTVVFSGRPLSLPAVFEKSAAVLFAWQPGSEAGNGIADLLFGDVFPSARMCMSTPVDVGQVPIYYNLYMTGRPEGGRYRDQMPYDPQFWFGHGMTYTKFEYSSVKISGNEAVATVKNVGSRDGVETVQLYIRQMVCHDGARPMQELRGFKKIALKPGEKAEVRFALTDEVLGYVDRSGKKLSGSGEFKVWIAPRAQCGEPALFTR